MCYNYLMSKQNIYFIILIVLFGLLTLSILSNFVIVLILAYIFSTLIRPIHVRIQSFLSRIRFVGVLSNSLAACITILFFIMVIITPITIILGRVAIDTQSVYQNVSSGNINLDFIGDKVQGLFGKVAPQIHVDLNKVVESVSAFFVSNIGNIFSGTVDIALKLFLFIFAMFYFLKDGKQFRELYTTVSPLKAETDNKIFSSIKQSVSSILLGSITVALVQGIFTGLGFWMFGVPNPFFFGTLAGFLALIPGVGAAAVWIPAAGYLFLTRPDSLVWVYQVLWGVLAVGLIDNFIGPMVVNKGIKIHPLFILLSIIGGIAVFGPEGFLFGPLILSMFVAIIKIWNENTVL